MICEKIHVHAVPTLEVKTLDIRSYLQIFFALFSEVSTKDETAQTEIHPIRSGGAGFAV